MNAVDAKGRLSVPSFIRQKVERRSDEKVLILGQHPQFDCLIGYDTNHVAALLKKAEQRLGENPDPFAELDMQAGILGGTLDVPYDPSGRIILPPRLKRNAGIQDLVLFVGTGDEFLIWNPQKALETGSEKLRTIASDLLEERAA